jgi:hypothetical protein
MQSSSKQQAGLPYLEAFVDNPAVRLFRATCLALPVNLLLVASKPRTRAERQIGSEKTTNTDDNKHGCLLRTAVQLF